MPSGHDRAGCFWESAHDRQLAGALPPDRRPTYVSIVQVIWSPETEQLVYICFSLFGVEALREGFVHPPAPAT